MSMSIFFEYLELVEDFLWNFLGVPVIVVLGIYFSVKSGFVQVRKFPYVLKRFWGYLSYREDEGEGVHPLMAFFACVGGCIGIGNIVAVCTAVQIGGPGALFWVWLTALSGMMLKYGEVYLGMTFRRAVPQGGFHGGPMFYLQQAFGSSLPSMLFCLLFCLYGVEIFQFRVVAHTMTSNFHLNEWLVVAVLLFLVVFASYGGVKRVGEISSAIIPLFLILYVGMSLWVLGHNIQKVPAILYLVLSSAFTGEGALGGAAGSAIVMVISQGVRRGAYTGDVGIGYASVIHSQSSVKEPERQASLVIMDLFLDTFIVCTATIMMILITDVWTLPIDASLLVQEALSIYFPYMHFFMPLFLFLLGYSTINAYFVVGLNCADYLSPRFGRSIFYAYALLALTAFSFVETRQAIAVMGVVGCLLLILNCAGIFILRKKIRYF